MGHMIDISFLMIKRGGTMSRRVQGKLVYPLWPRFADNDPDIKSDQGPGS